MHEDKSYFISCIYCVVIFFIYLFHIKFYNEKEKRKVFFKSYADLSFSFAAVARAKTTLLYLNGTLTNEKKFRTFTNEL